MRLLTFLALFSIIWGGVFTVNAAIDLFLGDVTRGGGELAVSITLLFIGSILLVEALRREAGS